MGDLFDMKNIAPMLIAEKVAPFADSEYLYEMKWDGERCVAYLDPAGGTELRNKRNVRMLPKVPELSQLHKQVSKRCILDGELLCVVDGISFDRISMDRVKAPFVVNCFYFCDPDGMSDYVASKEPLPADERTPEICRLSFTNIRCRNAHWSGVYLYGLPERKIREAHLENIDIFFAPDAEWGTPAMMRDCPKVCRLGILAENIEKLRMKNVRIDGKEISTDSYTP